MSVVEERVGAAQPRQAEPPSDLGFGSVVVRETRRRLLNRDGSFNVRRVGAHWWESLSVYHTLLTISWPRFFAVVVAWFLFTNAVFAAIYALAGDGALSGVKATTLSGRFAESFFFSVHTLATIGYGTIAPATLLANIIVTFETLIGLVGVAVIAGTFGRFSRPVRILQPQRRSHRTAAAARSCSASSTSAATRSTSKRASTVERDSAASDREFINLASSATSRSFRCRGPSSIPSTRRFAQRLGRRRLHRVRRRALVPQRLRGDVLADRAHAPRTKRPRSFGARASRACSIRRMKRISCRYWKLDDITRFL
jgi:hypothetical protein